jgi:hypothetical protein
MPCVDPTQVGVFFTDATTDYKYAIVLGLPGNIGMGLLSNLFTATDFSQDCASVLSSSPFWATESDIG